MTSFTTELATPTVTDIRTDTVPHLIYKDTIKGPEADEESMRPAGNYPWFMSVLHLPSMF